MKPTPPQPGLFSESYAGTYRARARVSDDLTSHEAAALVNRTGTAQRHADLVMAEVVRKPGQTAAEIAAAIGLDHVQAQRRLSDFERAEQIHKGAARRCAIKGGRRMVTWWPGRNPHAE